MIPTVIGEFRVLNNTFVGSYHVAPESVEMATCFPVVLFYPMRKCGEFDENELPVTSTDTDNVSGEIASVINIGGSGPCGVDEPD